MCEAPSTIRRAGPAPLTTAVDSSPAWSQIEYTYDPSGRRIAKDIDGVVTKYLYDGSHCIAEYDANDVLLRKYIYGPGVDQPICMIDVADANAAYYYHYDALGSVVALSDSAGDTVQLYEYDVYGQVAASDPNHPNPFLFTGRRYDTETGLYYYRARYYNPTIGRFLQTDPIGYGDGMNMYAYCGNNPVCAVDPSGHATIRRVPTGNVYVVPGKFGSDPVSGAAVNIVSLGKMFLDKGLSLMEMTAGVLGYAAGLNSKLTTQNCWRVFIEFRDGNDIDDSGVVGDEGDLGEECTEEVLWSDPYWMEVVDVKPLEFTDDGISLDSDTRYTNMAGYDDKEAAMGAAWTAVLGTYNSGNGYPLVNYDPLGAYGLDGSYEGDHLKPVTSLPGNVVDMGQAIADALIDAALN